MATLTIHQIDDHLAQTYLNASDDQQQQVKRVVEGILLLMAGTLMQTSTASGPVRRLLKKGNLQPFRPFQAVTMKGEGPTAAEMVIQDRD